MRRSTFNIFGLVLLLAGCLDAPADKDDAKLDERIAGRGNADPLLVMAIEDQIMVDTALANQSNAHSLMPAPSPATVPIPLIADETDAPAKARDGA